MTSNAGSRWDVGSVPLIAPEVLTDIVSAMADMAVVIDRSAVIQSVLSNPFHGAMAALGTWEGRDIRSLLSPESVPKFDRAFQLANDDATPPRATELNHLDPQTDAEFPISYSLHRLGTDGTFLMLGRDLRPIADLQQQLVNAQIEVERDYERQRGFDTRFRVLMHATKDPIVFISVGNGQIDEVNGAAASLLGRTAEELRGTDFSDFFEGFTKGELNADLAAAALADGRSSLTLTLRRKTRRVTVQPSFFRAGGRRMLLCRIAPLALAENQPQTDTPEAHLGALFDHGPDGIVFTDAEGRILSANDGFLSLVEATDDAEVRASALSDYLDRGVFEQTALLDNAIRLGSVRSYATHLRGPFDARTAVDLSATRLGDERVPIFAFVIRDAGRTEASRGQQETTLPISTADSSSVAELIGSTSLREIVSDTTDVIEKMCIEAALQLTGNNRAAAAEILGLSRQSLYVKLRKFDLVGQPDAD